MANNNTSNGIGIGTILFLIFMTLKLTGFIDLSLWWVTSPLWIPLALIIAIGGIGALILISRNK
jgi:hypothetical protein